MEDEIKCPHCGSMYPVDDLRTNKKGLGRFSGWCFIVSCSRCLTFLGVSG